MKCRTCGKEVTHYYFTQKPYCNQECEDRDENSDTVEFLKGIFGMKDNVK